MTRRYDKPYRLLLLFLLVTSAAKPAHSQQGQYHISEMPFLLPEIDSGEGFATYSPIKSIDGATLVLKSLDDTTFTFTLDAKTIYCQGAVKSSDWSFLKKVRKSLTVLTVSNTDNKALVVWDQPPVISTVDGRFTFTLPPLCQ
jgi:hypothetical protein